MLGTSVAGAGCAPGVGRDGRWLFVLGGVLLAGPLVCGTSQAVNDWFDRHVDQSTDRFNSASGVKRCEDQVSGQCGLDGDFRSLAVSHFADKHDFGVLS